MIEPFFKGNLSEVIKQLAINSNAQFNDQSLGDEIICRFIFDKIYTVYLHLVPTTEINVYTVNEFRSIEATENLGTSIYLQAYRASALTTKPRQPWVVTSVPSLMALFEAHTRWSKFFKKIPVFVTE